ncbi:MAG TPA: hypothetical protein VLK89_07420 [Solirubrobacterales bacterium]|nr:hypothetical protein [Solirubrobacterales bacterium]
MRVALKGLIAAVAALLLAVALAACGGGGDSSSTTTETTAQGQAAVESSAGGPAQGKAKSGSGEAKSGSSESGAKSGSSGDSGNFVPKHHHDSGGGSAQFRVKGGDNSIQEFGAEADTSEFDAAATALHNFLDARAAGDWAAACTYISKGVTESLEKLAAQAKQGEEMGCGVVLEKLTNPAAKQLMRNEAAKASVASLRFEGESAFIIYTGVSGTVLAIPMASEGGTWKVASLAGTPLQ